jgi:hypothetical protein
MWTIVWWYRLGLIPNLSTRALWQPPVLSGGPDISRASRRMDEGNENLIYPSSWDFKRSLTCRKILLRNSGFTSHPKEGVLRIFIALKNPSPCPDSNLLPLGPVASTLTTTSPRLPAGFILWSHLQYEVRQLSPSPRLLQNRRTLTALSLCFLQSLYDS